MKVTAATGVAFLFFATSLCAQEALVGKYSGAYTEAGSVGRSDGVTLEITSASDGNVAGKATRAAWGATGPRVNCAGEYKLEGTYADNKIVLRSSKGGRAGDCTMNLQLVVDGGKLKGKLDQADVELSRTPKGARLD